METRLRSGQVVNLTVKQVREIEEQVLKVCKVAALGIQNFHYFCCKDSSVVAPPMAKACADAGLLQKDSPVSSGYGPVTFKPEVIAIVDAMSNEHSMMPIDPINGSKG